MSDLKPCPFCGIAMRGNGNPFWECGHCAANVPKCVWDTRPIEDALNARIAELEAALRQVDVDIDAMTDRGNQLMERGDNTTAVALLVAIETAKISARVRKVLEAKCAS